MSKYCVDCGKEIPQSSKNDTCENCQNKKIGAMRKFGEKAVGIVGTIISVGLLVIGLGKLGGPKK